MTAPRFQRGGPSCAQRLRDESWRRRRDLHARPGFPGPLGSGQGATLSSFVSMEEGRGVAPLSRVSRLLRFERSGPPHVPTLPYDPRESVKPFHDLCRKVVCTLRAWGADQVFLVPAGGVAPPSSPYERDVLLLDYAGINLGAAWRFCPAISEVQTRGPAVERRRQGSYNVALRP